MKIERFIKGKVMQMTAYIQAVSNQQLHFTELDQFITDTMSEWTLLEVVHEAPKNAQERVFWHLMHEVSLYGGQSLQQDLFFKSEMNTCIDFVNGIGSYPIDCIGWRPMV